MLTAVPDVLARIVEHKRTDSPHWKKKTTMDGFGRTVKAERGHNNAVGGTKTIVDTEYEACACSPLGKVKRVSLPYAPGGSVLWTTFTYDSLGPCLAYTETCKASLAGSG